ncbi:hypothetical protein RP20_CCG027442 [Aedes albopictus]|nr:hypothetical protein RP20_CCG027442 [Aedes albopictus]
MSSSVACTIEPYRRGTSFNDWFARLKFFFKVNKISEDDKMAYFITLSGPVMFDEIKLLYPAGNFEEAAFDDLISKLKNRLDKTEPDLVQRYKFSTRIQNPEETTEDFVLALKLQAEFCGFANFKETAILDRLIAGIKDKNLRQRLLSEEKLTLASAEKIIVTWEVARANAGTAIDQQNAGLGQIAAVRNTLGAQEGKAYGKLRQTLELARKYRDDNYNRGAGSSRGPVKSRLGVRSYDYGQQGRGERLYGSRTTDFRQERRDMTRPKPDYSQMICNFCGLKGHIRRRCFKLKNLHRDAVNLVDSPGPSTDHDIAELMGRMQTYESDGEESDSDTCWKRRGNGTSKPNTSS